MNTETHRQLASDIWSISNLLRGPYKRNEYRKVKIGYEIPLNRHFFHYEPPCVVAVIEGEIKTLVADIVRLLDEETA